MAGRVVAFVGLVCWAMAAAGAAPTTGPADSERVAQWLAGIEQQAMAALAGGEPQAAIDALADARTVVEQRQRAAALTPADPVPARVLNLLVGAYLNVRRIDRAAQLYADGGVLDRAEESAAADRQTVINRAIVDCLQGVNPMRAAKRITDYVKARPQDNDLVLMDLLCTALWQADEKVKQRTTLEALGKTYEELNAAMEKQYGGHRWGVQWLSPKNYQAERKRRDKAVGEYQKARDEYNRAAEDRAVAQKLADAGVSFGVGGRATRVRDADAPRKLAVAKQREKDAREAMDKAQEAIPRPPVLDKLDLLQLAVTNWQPLDVAMLRGAPRPGGDSDVAVADKPPPRVAVVVPPPRVEPLPPRVEPLPPRVEPLPPRNPPAAEPPKAPPSRFSRLAVGFAIAPDLLLTSAQAVRGAREVRVEVPGSGPLDAEVVAAEPDGPLAVIRVKGQQWAYLNFAAAFKGGPIQCLSFPEVTVFDPILKSIKGSSRAPQDAWMVTLVQNPRLPGAPLLDAAGELVGMALPERDLDRQSGGYSVSAVPLDKLVAFCQPHLPDKRCANPEQAAVGQVTATFGK